MSSPEATPNTPQKTSPDQFAKVEEKIKTSDPVRKKDETKVNCAAAKPEIDVTVPADYGLRPVKKYAGAKAPPQQEIIVKNTGRAPLVVSSIEVVGAHKTDFKIVENQAIATIAVGDSKKLVVTFEPGEEGDRTATLRVMSNANLEPQVNRDLLGKGGVPKMKVEPSPLDFKTWVVTKKSQPLNITIESTGNVELTLSSIAITESVDGQYTEVKPEGWDKPLEPGKKLEVPVTFEAKKDGEHKGKLKVQSNAANTESVEVELKAKAFNLKNPDNPPRFASSAETVKLKYDVEDSAAVITKAKLEIFDKKNALIFTRDLDKTKDEYKHGNRELDCTGKINSSTAGYPDDYLTVEHSPYKWKVTAEADDCTDTAFVEKEIKVEIHSVKLEIGEDATLVKQRHKTAFQTLGGALPGRGLKTRLKLNSNIFKTALPERLHGDITDYNNYQDMNTGATDYEHVWGDGPLVPIYAKITVKDTGGNEKDAPKALGDVPVLWDYKDVAKDVSGLHAQAQRFVKDAQEHDCSQTKPKGDNCHTFYGGKRGEPSSSMFLTAFAADEVQAFPFQPAAAATTRTWSVHTKPLRTGPKASKTGVMFRPNRMAGDAYEVHAYVDIDKAKDVVTDLPDELHDWTGTFEIWRQIDVVKVYYKSAATVIYNHAAVMQQYEKAFVEMRNLAGAATPIPQHNLRFKNGINSQKATSVKTAIIADFAVVNKDNNSTDGSKAAIAIKDYDVFYNAYLDSKSTNALVQTYRTNHAVWVTQKKAKPTKWNDNQVDTEIKRILRGQAENTLTAEDLYDPTQAVRLQKYADATAEFAKKAMLKACNEALQDSGADGVTIFHFEYVTNLSSSLNGVALNATSHTGVNRISRNTSGYVQTAPASYYTGQKSMDQTVAHEIGHCLFLPHTQYEVGNVEDADAHDLSDDRCLMCYNFNRPRRFCGYCLLRLRGWNHDALKLKSDGQNAKKPKLTVSIDPSSFETVKPNETWVIGKVVLVNAHDKPLTIADITLGGAGQGDYTVEGTDAAKKEVAPGESVELSVKFNPTATGTRALTLTVASDHAITPSQTVTLNNNGTKLEIAAGPAGPFTGTATRISVAKKLEVKNTGNGALTVNGFQLSGDHAADYSLEEAAAATTTLPVNGTASLKVKVTPSAAGARKAELKISSTDPESPKNVTLHSEGQKPAITVTPNPLAFGNVPFPTNKVLQLTLNNTGAQPLTVDRIVIDGPNGTDVTIGAGLPVTIASGGPAVQVPITYTCSAKGDKTAKLRVHSNAPTSPNEVAVTAKGTLAELELSSASNFSDTAVAKKASTFLTADFKLKNIGDADLAITGPPALAGDTADWEVTNMPNVYPATVTPGSTHTARLRFKPQTAGNKTIRVTPATDAPGTPDVWEAIGTAKAEPILRASTAGPLHFPNTMSETKSAVQTVTIFNDGVANLAIASITAGKHFGVENHAGGMTVAPNGQCSFDVFFQAETSGAKNATVTVTSNDGANPLLINLDGTATKQPVTINPKSWFKR